MQKIITLNNAVYKPEPNIQISDDEKWHAVTRCDEKYDGLFYYGVKTTGIFCRPSCRAKNPLRDNAVFFDSAEKAIKDGFRPCKKCRPDLIAFKPDIELAEKARVIFDANYDKIINLSHISKQLGTTTNQLIKLFKQHIGITPMQYITRLKIDKASYLLEQTNVNILEIAYMVGFNSLSNFYKCFKTQIGQTPSEYRRNRREM